jgi:hypothetical protein
LLRPVRRNVRLEWYKKKEKLLDWTEIKKKINKKEKSKRMLESFAEIKM